MDDSVVLYTDAERISMQRHADRCRKMRASVHADQIERLLTVEAELREARRRIGELEVERASVRERRLGTETGVHKVERWIAERDDALGALQLAEQRITELEAQLSSNLQQGWERYE